MTFSIRAGLLAVLTGAALVAGCKKAPPPQPPEAAAPQPPPPPPPVAVQTVDLGKGVGADKRVAAPMTTFGVRDTIYASVATTGAASVATLSAKWTFEPDKLVDSTTIQIAPTGPAVTEFHILRKTAWPVGKYKVAITLDGKSVAEKEFDVKK